MGTPESTVEEPFPARFICPFCGADSDAADKVFEISAPAFIPHADYALVESLCCTCGVRTYFGVFPVRGRDHPTAPDDASVGMLAEDRALLERYLTGVEAYRHEWQGAYEYSEEQHVVDLAGDDVQLFDPSRFVTVPARVLAAARGLRHAVAAHPGSPPAGLLAAGQFTFALSLDATPQGPMQYALHLSVMNTLAPGMLSLVEQEFVLSLFFTPGERPLLCAEHGHVQPVTHFYLAADTPEVNES